MDDRFGHYRHKQYAAPVGRRCAMLISKDSSVPHMAAFDALDDPAGNIGPGPLTFNLTGDPFKRAS